MRSTAVALVSTLLALFGVVAPAAADYQFQPLGTFGNLVSEPSDLNDLGQVSGLLTGT